jgi:hypothetical protein
MQKKKKVMTVPLADDGAVGEQGLRRVGDLMDKLWPIVLAEHPTIGVSALVSMLSGLLAGSSTEPIDDAEALGRVLQLRVKQHLAGAPAKTIVVTR